MRKLLVVAAAAAVVSCATPALAVDEGPAGLRGFFSGTTADGTPFSGMLFYLGLGSPDGFMDITVDGTELRLPLTHSEAVAPLLSPPTPTNGAAFFYAFDNAIPQDVASFAVRGINGQIGSGFVPANPTVADWLNLGQASASFTFGNISGDGPVQFHFDFAPALPEPGTWTTMKTF